MNEAEREAARVRKQRSRLKQRGEAARKQQQWMEENNPETRWQRNRVERAEEYAALLRRRTENQDDLTWLQTFAPLLKAAKDVPLERLLAVAASAIRNIDANGFEDYLQCPAEWLQEFIFARESALRAGKNIEWYEFGVGGLRIPRDLWTQFAALAGAYVKRVVPNFHENDTARRLVEAGSV